MNILVPKMSVFLVISLGSVSRCGVTRSKIMIVEKIPTCG